MAFWISGGIGVPSSEVEVLFDGHILVKLEYLPLMIDVVSPSLRGLKWAQ